MMQAHRTYRTLIIGAGPAGTGPLVSALQQGHLGMLLDRSIAIADQTAHMGRGTIGQYIINSDTVGATMLECLRENTLDVFQHVVRAHPTQIIEQRRTGAVPLQVVSDYMALIGDALQDVITTHPTSCFLPNTTAQAIRLCSDGGFETTLLSDMGTSTQTLCSETVVLALGGSQQRERALSAELVAGVNLQPYAQKVLLTNHVLTACGTREIEQRLQGSTNPRIVIIGGSHSAFSSAWTLLHRVQGVTFGAGSITILHRDKLKLFYPSREAALGEGYTDFTDADICPVTNRLFRLGGFRLDSRELLMRIWGMRGADVERRVQLCQLRPADDNPADIRVLLEAADIIIPAFGYRPNTIPIYDSSGSEIEILVNRCGTPPLVDTECRVLDRNGAPIPGIYGIGLASGFRLTGNLGGEPSFTGQTNGLWLYQNGVGEIILNHLLEQQVAKLI